MAIAFDTYSRSEGISTSVSHTCTGSDMILYVHIYSISTSDVVSDVTFDGNTMTRVNSQSFNAGRTYLYRYYVGTGSGTGKTIQTTSSAYIFIIGTSYTGVSSTSTYVSNINSGTGNTVSVALTPNSSNNWITMAGGNQGTAPFTGSDSAVVRIGGTNVAIQAFDTDGTVNNVSTTMTANDTGGGGWGLVAESFEPSGSATTKIPLLTLLGVGT